MRISIVIVNRNGEVFASKLMGSLIHSCKNCERIEGCRCEEIIIVDNASTDNSLRIFEEYSKKITKPLIKIVRLRRNTGFCYTVNIGVALANTELVAILNPDCTLTRIGLFQLLKIFEKHPRLGVVQPLICWYQNPERILFTG